MANEPIYVDSIDDVPKEAKTSRKDYLLLASQIVETGREKILKMAATDNTWRRIVNGYDRLAAWLSATAPQLEVKNHWIHAFVNSLTIKPMGNISFNCGF